jgi:hypothetical protein
LADSPVRSTYAFCEKVVGYDLAGFFERNADALQENVDEVINHLLEPSG